MIFVTGMIIGIGIVAPVLPAWTPAPLVQAVHAIQRHLPQFTRS